MPGDDVTESITGQRGELVTLLVTVVGQCLEADPNFPFSPVMQLVGAAEPVGLVPTTWELDQLGMRLLDLIDSGMDEEFLIRAMRDAISREVAILVNVQPSMFDEDQFKFLNDLIETPEGLASLRPSAPSGSDQPDDDEFRDQLREVLAMVAPIPADAIAAIKSINRKWRELSTTYLGEDVFGVWLAEQPP
jgi:hypothetical protein